MWSDRERVHLLEYKKIHEDSLMIRMPDDRHYCMHKGTFGLSFYAKDLYMMMMRLNLINLHVLAGCPLQSQRA